MSWIHYSEDTNFPIQNLPYGVFSTPSCSDQHIGVAIGDYVLDLALLQKSGLLNNLGYDSNVLTHATLNAFMKLNKAAWTSTRSRLIDLLSNSSTSDSSLQSNELLKKNVLIPIDIVKMHLPAAIGDYTDFYSSREHATNVGIMLRGKDNALQANWLHLPVGYHGRSSSVVISGTDVVRPCGQLQADKEDATKGSIYSPCRTLDFELEMAFFVGGETNTMGVPIDINNAEDRIFGSVLMNDWSARDIQAWEYVPLGPFTAKNFATSISPWVVTLEALQPFRCQTSAGEAQISPKPLDYLYDSNYGSSSYDVKLEVLLQPNDSTVPSTISTSNLKYMYWNAKQQLVHHSISGCPMNAGDLLGTGTISGPDESSMGSMLELSWRGSRDVVLRNSFVTETDVTTGVTNTKNDVRKFLKDGDTVIMRGHAQGDGYRIGFGSVSGKILPSGTIPSTAAANDAKYSHFQLFNYWRSSSSYRVRIAMALKGIKYEYIPVDLMPLVGNTNSKLPAEFINDTNLMEQVPVLQFKCTTHGDTAMRLTQSLPIIEFLDESYPDSNRLLPACPIKRAKVREISEIINSGIQPLHNIRCLRQIQLAILINSANTPETATVDSNGFAKDAIKRGLDTLERLIHPFVSNSPAGKFAVGTSTPTLADICIVPQLYAAKRFGFDLSDYPVLNSVYELCNTLEAFKASAPEVQPDAR